MNINKPERTGSLRTNGVARIDYRTPPKTRRWVVPFALRIERISATTQLCLIITVATNRIMWQAGLDAVMSRKLPHGGLKYTKRLRANASSGAVKIHLSSFIALEGGQIQQAVREAATICPRPLQVDLWPWIVWPEELVECKPLPRQDIQVQ